MRRCPGTRWLRFTTADQPSPARPHVDARGGSAALADATEAASTHVVAPPPGGRGLRPPVAAPGAGRHGVAHAAPRPGRGGPRRSRAELRPRPGYLVPGAGPAAEGSPPTPATSPTGSTRARGGIPRAAPEPLAAGLPRAGAARPARPRRPWSTTSGRCPARGRVAPACCAGRRPRGPAASSTRCRACTSAPAARGSRRAGCLTPAPRQEQVGQQVAVGLEPLEHLVEHQLLERAVLGPRLDLVPRARGGHRRGLPCRAASRGRSVVLCDGVLAPVEEDLARAAATWSSSRATRSGCRLVSSWASCMRQVLDLVRSPRSPRQPGVELHALAADWSPGRASRPRSPSRSRTSRATCGALAAARPPDPGRGR